MANLAIRKVAQIKKRRSALRSNKNHFNFFYLNKIFFFLYTRIKFIFFVLFILSILLICYSIYINTNRYLDNVIPEKINIYIPNQEISKNVFISSEQIIKIAHKFHYNKKWILKNIQNSLNSETKIDQYWVRFNLDKSIRIDATLLIPSFYIIDKNNDIFLVSTNSKIIEKNPKLYEIITLPSVQLDDEIVLWCAHKNQLCNEKKEKNALVLSNIQWLKSDSLELFRNYYDKKLNYKIVGLNYSLESGFKLNISKSISSEITNKYEINFGSSRIKNMDRLQFIIDDLEKRQIHFAQINLDYENKGLVREGVFLK